MKTLRTVAKTYDIMDRMGVKPTYWNMMILYHVANSPGVTQGQLATLIENPPINLSPILTKLVRSGILARDIDMQDMRHVQYRLTTVGETLVQAIEEVGGGA